LGQIFTASIRHGVNSLPLSYAPLPTIRAVDLKTVSRTSMDALYLLFSIVLFAAALGFLLICDRLGRRP